MSVKAQIVRRKPRSASLRLQTFLSSHDITTRTPEKSLCVGLRKHGGRNAYGRITMRHKGGGAARLYRIIDFFRRDRDIEGRVTTVEYDPNRNVRIALVVYKNGVKRYVLKPEGVEVGSIIVAGRTVEAKPGNCLPIRAIPVGFQIHNVEITPGSGGVFARSAGTTIQ